MASFFVSFFSFLLLLFQEAIHHSFHWLVDCTVEFPFRICGNGNVEKEVVMIATSPQFTMLDLPELALDIILAKLSPGSLRSMSCVCTSLRGMCMSDHLWKKHMEEKWGRVFGKAAKKEWEAYMESRKWAFSWLKDTKTVMAQYLALESGRFWFPAQVYNREKGNVGFRMSCYDAQLSYDSETDTFFARYPPYGHGVGNVEEGVKWERLRAPPVDTPPLDLHVSDCLHDLCPGDHIEIQWRKNKGFPYGWWYGVVGHSASCDGNEHHCRCSSNDTVTLEFNQHTPDSIWRRTTISRKDHTEIGGETDGFYGGIRKIYSKNEISMWMKLSSVEILEQTTSLS